MAGTLGAPSASRPRPRSPWASGVAAATLLTAVALLTGCAPPDSPEVVQRGVAGTVDLSGVAPRPETAAVDDRADLQAALDAVAAAFSAGDADAVADWLHDPDSAFGVRWRSRAGWFGDVPTVHYALRLDPSLGDLASEAVRERTPGAQVVYVVEELALEGFDDPDHPAAHDLFLTVVRTDDGWRIAGDSDAEPLGLVSVDHLWDLGPVEVTRRGALAALHRPGMPEVADVLASMEAALQTTRERWPLPFDGAVAVTIPESQEELGELLHVTFDLSNFVAFATSTSSSELGEYELAGSRIVINPDRFLRHNAATRASILVHELVHVATHEVAGPFLPSWLNEGVAQSIGERRSATGTALLEQHTGGQWDHRPPSDADFVVGGRDRVFLSYQLAWSFVDHLVNTYGAAVVADFYAAAGQGGVGRPGTEPWHLDRAAREVFGVGMDELSEAWAAAI